jgi:hypothetical protein
MSSHIKSFNAPGGVASFAIPADCAVLTVTVSGAGASYTASGGVLTISPTPAAGAPVVVTITPVLSAELGAGALDALVSGGTIEVLNETVFAGMATGALSAGANTLDSRSWYATLGAGGGAAEIVATGLSITNGSGETSVVLSAGATGLSSFLSARDWRRGRVGYWMRTASYAFTSSTTAYAYFSPNMSGWATHWVAAGRGKNTMGAANTAAGSQLLLTGWLGTQTNYVTTTGADDVYLIYQRTPTLFDLYSGVWAGDWPSMDDMTLRGTAHLFNLTATAATIGSSLRDVGAWVPGFLIGGTGTAANMIIDRFRTTVWK